MDANVAKDFRGQIQYRTRAAAITACLGLSLLAACSGGGSDGAPTGTGGGDRKVSAPDARLARLLLYQVDDAAEYELTERLVQSCMAEKDLPYKRTAFDPRFVSRTGPGGSLAQRKVNGFGYAVEPLEPTMGDLQEENTAYMREYGQPWTAAAQDCNTRSGEAFSIRSQQLIESLSKADRSFLEKRQLASLAAIEEAQPAWSSCMADKGFTFASQDAMDAELQADAAADGAADREIGAAVADVACDQKALGAAKAALYADIVAEVGGVDALGDPYAKDWEAPEPD